MSIKVCFGNKCAVDIASPKFVIHLVFGASLTKALHVVKYSIEGNNLCKGSSHCLELH